MFNSVKKVNICRKYTNKFSNIKIFLRECNFFSKEHLSKRKK